MRGRESEERGSERRTPQKQEMKMKPERSRERKRRRIEEEKETVRTNEPVHPNWE